MSFFKVFTGSKRDKAVAAESKGSQDDINRRKKSSPSHSGQEEVGGSTMPSLFSGMTISSGPATPATAEAPDLMDMECAVAPVAEATLMPTTGKPTSLATSTIIASPTVIAAEQEAGQSSSDLVSMGKRKKRVQAKRPGYARTSNKSAQSERISESEVKSQPKEAAPASKPSTSTTKLSATSSRESDSETATAVPVAPSVSTPTEPSLSGMATGAADDSVKLEETDGKNSSSFQAPLYSIGTPSSSDENLTDTKYDEQTLSQKCVEDLPDDAAVSLVELHNCLPSAAPNSLEKEMGNFCLDNTDTENVYLLDGNQQLDKDFILSMERSEMKTEDGTSIMPVSDPLGNDKMDFTSLGESPKDATLTDDLGSMRELGDSLEGDHPLHHQVKQMGYSAMEQNSEGIPSTGEYVEGLEDLEDSPTLDHVEMKASEGREGPANYSVVLDTHDKLELLLQHHQSQLSELSEDKHQLEELVGDLLLLYSNDNKLQRQKEQELHLLQQEESQALANDSYDLAEEKNACIEELRRQLQAMKYRLPAQDDKVKAALSLRDELNKREAECHRTVQTSLEELREEQTWYLKEYKDSNAGKLSRERMALSSKRQQLSRALGHLQLDREHLLKGETELDGEIESQTREFQVKKEELLQNRKEIQEEIAEMEMRLAELRRKEAEFTDAIKREDDKMDDVRKEFDPQRKLLIQQRREIDDRQRLLGSEKDELSTAQEAFDEKSAEFEKRQERLETLVTEIHEAIQASRETAEQLSGDCERTNEYSQVDHFVVSVTPELLSLQQDRDQCGKKLKDLEENIQQTERNMNSLKKRLNEIEAHISELESAKENAKQARNFKEAKRIKEEIEALNTEGQESQQKLESLRRDLANSRNLLKKAQEENERIEAELKEKEYQAALSNVGAAARTVDALSRQAANYQADVLLSALLAAEIASCQNLILDLCEKHNIPKPELEVAEAEEPEEVDDPQEEVGDSKEDAATTEDKQRERDELMSRLDELEGKLEAAVDVEDFDRADDIQQDILKVKDRIAALKQDL